ncbi:MAG TPA: hypothetical protein VFS33_05150, partial [Gemmatimonadales bacterium]|nr:hypothetical protein [Gemmatimonadales bacterium]
MSYLGAAESLVHHGNLRIPVGDWFEADSTAPLHHFPPGFSIAIAVPVAAGLAPVQGARIVMAAGAGVAVGTAAWLADLAAGWAAAVLVALLLALLPAIMSVHVEVLSEPLFLALLAVMLALMVRPRAADSPRSAGGRAAPSSDPSRLDALGYGTSAALGAMVRYAGLSLGGAAMVWAYREGGSRAERVRRVLVAAAPTAVLFGAWVIRTTAQQQPIRQVGLFPRWGDNLRQLGATVVDQLAPSVESAWLRAVLAVVAGGLLLALLWDGVCRARADVGGANASARGTDADPTRGAEGTKLTQSSDPAPTAARGRLYPALGVIGACYVAELVLARLVADPGIPFDGRLLSPLIFLSVLGAAVAIALGWPRWRPLTRAVAAVALLAWSSGASSVFVDEYTDLRAHGTGYARDEWRDSPVTAWLRTEGRRFALFTNHPMIAYLETGRASRELPDSLSAEILQDFRDAL